MNLQQLNVGPEASLSLLIGQAITQVLHGDPNAEVPHSVGYAVATMITFQVTTLPPPLAPNKANNHAGRIDFVCIGSFEVGIHRCRA